MPVDVHDVFSPSNRRRFAVWSWTPPSPGPSPLLVLLHGVYDSGGHSWWLRARVHEAAAELAASGTLPVPPVILMPTDTGVEFGSGYADWHDGSANAETWIAHELIAWADSTFELDGRRWVTGLSMGGYGALLLALRNPGLFQSATSTSGLFTPARLLSYGPDMTGRIWADAAGMAEHDVTKLVNDRPLPERVAFDCGAADPHIDDNRKLHQQLKELGIAHSYVEHAGTHDWDYWRARFPDHLRFHAGLPSPFAGSTSR